MKKIVQRSKKCIVASYSNPSEILAGTQPLQERLLLNKKAKQSNLYIYIEERGWRSFLLIYLRKVRLPKILNEKDKSNQNWTPLHLCHAITPTLWASILVINGHPGECANQRQEINSITPTGTR